MWTDISEFLRPTSHNTRRKQKARIESNMVGITEKHGHSRALSAQDSRPQIPEAQKNRHIVTTSLGQSLPDALTMKESALHSQAVTHSRAGF